MLMFNKLLYKEVIIKSNNLLSTSKQINYKTVRVTCLKNTILN